MNDYLARAGAFALALQSFCAAHPELSVPLIGALVTFLVKPRTPEQYERIAKFSPRLAAGLQLFAALFPDPVKASKVATKLLTGKGDDGKSLPPPPTLSVIALVVIAPMLTGCALLQQHAKDALSVAQIGCIIANQFEPDSKVAEICQIADDYFEPMQRVLGDARQASDRAAAEAAQSTRAALCGKRLEP